MFKRRVFLIRWIMLLINGCLVTLLLASSPVNAQIPSSKGQIGSSPSTTIGAQEVITMTPVQLDGRTLFTIAGMSPNDSKTSEPLDNRAEFIEESLYKLLEEDFEPESLRVEVHDKGDHTKIVASDNKKLKDVPLFILTPLDARVAGFTLEESSNYIAKETQKALKQAWQERQPSYLKRQVRLAGMLVISAIALSTIIWLLQKQLKKREATLREQKTACEHRMNANMIRTAEVSEATSDTASSAIGLDEDATSSTGYHRELATEQLHNRRMLGSQGLQSYLLQITQGVIWLGVIAVILGLFPFTRAWEWTVLELPLLLGVLLIAIALSKASGIIVDRNLEKWLHHRQTLSPQQLERWLLRANSFTPIIKGAIATILITAAILFVLSQLGIPLAPVLAGAGILSLAISLGSQRLVADLISGTLILIEDQYAIGDFVTLNDNAFGRVERLNLRATSLRNRQGNLIILSNSDIKQVNNLSKDWARAKLYIPVHYSADVDRTIAVIQQVIDEMNADDFWREIIQEAEVRGVEDIDGYGFTIGVRFQTKPGGFRKVIRECRRRLKPAFDKANIQFAERPMYQSMQMSN
jgi:moderate conductance mechanosensitive channel